MGRKAKVEADTRLTLSTTSDFFSVTPPERHKRLTEFLKTLQSFKVDENRESYQKIKDVWADFHKRLCEHEPWGEYLFCFMDSVLKCNEAFSRYNLCVYKTIMDQNSSGNDVFVALESEIAQTELIRALKENCQNVPSKVTYKYMHVRVIPAIFSPVTTDEERQELCSLAVALPMGFAVQFMHKDTQHKYKQEVIQKYIPFIYERANATFRRDWMLMCQTLIHYSGKMLHSDTLLQNSILKVCEDAFKNASVENRCAAFDCWRALIDNYALERKYIMHPKQTALLLKPLLARISRNRIVAAKKFDTHVHLLMTIGFEKDLLANFLLEAFGPIDEELPEVPRGDVIHCVRDLTVSYPRSTEILLKVLRHEKETCGCANKTLPIADSCGPIKTEVAKWELLVHSVRMCSQLNYVSLAKARSDIIEQITKCLWSSMFKYFRNEKFNDNRVQVMKLIQSAITKVLNSSMMNITYYNIFFKHILTCLVDFLTDEAFDADIYKELVLPTIKELMTYQTKFNDKLPATIYDDCVKDIFMYCKQDPQFLDTIISSLNYPLLQCQLAGNAYAFALHEYTKIMDKSPNKYQDETLTNLFTRVVSINCNEKILATDFKEDSQLLESKSIVLMKVLTQLMKDSAMCFGLLKTSAAMLSNIVTLKNISDHVFYVFLLNVITNSLSMIAEDTTDHTTHLIECTNVFITALQQIISAREHHNKLKIDSMQLIVICTHLLKLKMYHVMEFLPDLLRYIDKQRLPRDLYNIFLNMTDAQDTDVSQKAVSVFEEICASGVKFVSPLKGKTSPVMKSDNINGIVSPKVVVLPQTILPAMSNNANSVRLFGKYFDSPSPKRCRGSILQRTKNMVAEARNLSLALDSSPTSTKSNANVRAIEDISSNAFVPVDKEVVFDKEKMTEQQREKTTKRRDDIPALYQDLSQSQSHSHSTPVNNDLVEMRVTRSSDTGLNLNGLQEVTEENGVTKVDIPSKPGAKRGRKPKRTKSASPSKARPSTFVPIEEYAHVGPLPTPEVKNEMNDLVTSENNSDDIARQKIEKSLKMNIVGSEEFFNLPKSRTRKSRCFDLGTVTYQDFPVLKKRRRRSKIETNQKSPENLNLNKTDVSPEVTTDENKIETTPDKDNSIPETPTIDNVIPETEKQNDTEVNQNESTPKMDATPESQVMATVTQALGKDCESVTVNLYRLPHYSPTKKELEDAKMLNKKVVLNFNSSIVSKIDFSVLDSNEDRQKNDETLTLEVAPQVPQDAISDMETESFISNDRSMHLVTENDESEVVTPGKAHASSISSLEASPITKDTPSRTKELLDNTLDISPIKTTQTTQEVARLSPDLFGSQASQEVGLPTTLTNGVCDVESNDFKTEETTAKLKQPSSRSAKLLTLIGHSAKMTANAKRTVLENNMKTAACSSPSTDRVRKMMLSCADSKAVEEQELQTVQLGDVLEFERAVPSPLALPKMSILKRKLPDNPDESLSPLPKRKRVNFPDPPTTCEKVYFKVIEESEKPIALRKKKRVVARLLTQEPEPTVEDAESPPEDASDAIQSMQNQIDGLEELEGVTPLDSSPTKEQPEENGRLSPLPSNPAPELLGGCLPTSYSALFSDSDDKSFIKGVFRLARDIYPTEMYLNLTLGDIPNNVIKKWMKEREDKEEMDT